MSDLMSDQMVIVGGGLAGAKAAQTLREEGYAGSIVLISAEAVRPYERPPLSKGLLLGTTDAEQPYVHPAGWYAEQGIDLRSGVAAVRIDRDAHTVELSDGRTVGYRRLLLATGSSPRHLEVPGADLPGVQYLRTLDQALELRDRLAVAKHVVIAGAGWIGLEVAAAARSAGAEVTVVELAALPLQRVLGDEVASIMADLHRTHGVTFRFGCTLRAVRGTGSVSSVELSDGDELPADLVVAGVGVRPNTELAEQAGLPTANGIRTDAALRTSDPDIFAAGDVASADHPLIGKPIRVEHWAHALNSGPAAARSMLDQPVTYERIPYFYTDQYSSTPSLGMEYAGYVEPGRYDQVVFRGSPSIRPDADPAFIAFWVADQRVLAAMNVNIWDVQDELQALVRAGYAGHRVDLVKLADPEVRLAALLS